MGIGGAVIRPLELHLAGGGRAVELDRVLVVELEVDEVGRIEDFKRRLLRLERRLERQHEMQRQLAIPVFEEVIDRLDELLLLAVGPGEGEEVELLQQFDIGLRQRRQLFAGVDPLGLGREPLQRVGREHFVKRPGVAHARDRAVGGVDHLALCGDPDMRMSFGGRGAERPRDDQAHQSEQHTQHVVPANAGTHNPGRSLRRKASANVPKRNGTAYGSPRSRGRLVETCRLSRRLRGFEQAPPPQQRVRLRLAAAEGDIGVLRVARTARRIDVIMQAFGGGGIEDVAGLLEGAEGIGVHHLRPHVAVIAGRIVIAGEDMAELRGPVPQRDFRGHADLFQLRLLERCNVAAGLGRLGVEFEVDQRRGDELDGGKALVEFSRGEEAGQQLVRQRLAGLVVLCELPQHLRLLLPVLVELRRQLDEVGKHRGPRQRGIGHVGQHAVQAVAELVEQRACIVRRQQRRLAIGALGEVADIDDQGAISPSSFCWSRSEVIQAPERFEGLAK